MTFLAFHDKAFLPRSFEVCFIPFYVSLVRPRLEFGVPACSPKMVTDVNHLELQGWLLESVTFNTKTAAAGLRFLAAATTFPISPHNMPIF